LEIADPGDAADWALAEVSPAVALAGCEFGQGFTSIRAEH
jgi:hypothetical protein